MDTELEKKYIVTKRKVLFVLAIAVLTVAILSIYNLMVENTKYEVLQETPQYVKVAVYGTEDDVIALAHTIAKKAKIQYSSVYYYSWGGKYYLIYKK